MKQREYKLLEAISADENATQAGLAELLGMAVGSVNWYIKRLITRGYLKATRMDRTRLRYNMTSDGLLAFRRNAAHYAKDSLKIYHQLRQQAKELISDLKARNIPGVYIEGNDPALDIFRLSCLELKYPLDDQLGNYAIRIVDGEYRLERHDVAVGARRIA